MGKFAELHKRWAAAKKDAPDQKIARKTFSKGLGPILDDLETAANDLLNARGSKAFNPEKIAELSPKVDALCAKAAKIAAEYDAAAKKLGWGDVKSAAFKLTSEIEAHARLEAKEWRPDKEYVALWKYVTLEMALSAAGLEDARTAEDLRKLMEKKNKDINSGKKDETEIKTTIERLSSLWIKGVAGKDYANEKAASIEKAVKMAWEIASPSSGQPPAYDAPEKLKKLVPTIQSSFNLLQNSKEQIDERLKALQAYVKKPEVQSSAFKKLGEDNVTTGESYRQWYTAALTKCRPEIARLPKLT
jgi:hypothetical protein